MKKFILLIFIALLLPGLVQSNDIVKNTIKKDLIKEFKLGNYQTGRKFLIAIPPNESNSFGWGDASLEIYISSAEDVNLKMLVLGKYSETFLKADSVYVVNEKDGLAKTEAECREYNQVTRKTVTIEADKAISVYVVNSKITTTEGYMAIPIDQWGTKYVHCSYYDNYESSTNNFAGGFLTLASEDNTLVNVALRGIGSEDIATIKGDDSKSIGDIISFKLNAGEVYQIEGNGLTRGQFDLTGTEITATKPIGVISYHQRTVLPIFTSSSRDHLSEMIPPVQALSTKYASISLPRGGSNKGDLFRIVAVEDNTNYAVSWHDLDSKQMLGNKIGILNNAGDFHEMSEVLTSDPSTKSITGTSVFDSDKPVLLMQYAYSAGWDGSSFDPFMLVVPPVDQYVTHTIVQAPANKTFDENYLHIIAKDISGDSEMSGLKSLTFDDKNIAELVPDFTSNRIPGTDLYWVKFAISSGSHQLCGDGTVIFGAYTFGFASVDSYGWTAAMSSKNLSHKDTYPPQVSLVSNSDASTLAYRVTEKYKEGEIEDGFIQMPSKVWQEPAMLLTNKYGFNSSNFKMPYTDETWKYGPHDDYIFYLEVDNKLEDAVAYFCVYDYVGNMTIDSIKYSAEKLVLINSNELSFGTILYNTDKTHTLEFVNNCGENIDISSISLSSNEEFSILSGDIQTTLAQDATHNLKVRYYPTEISKSDTDTLTIVTSKLTYKWVLRGAADDGVSILDDYTKEELIALAPNPVGNSESTLSFMLPKSGMTSVKLYDINGRLVKTLFNGEAIDGLNEVNINSTNIVSGSYNVVVEQGEFMLTTIVIIKK